MMVSASHAIQFSDRFQNLNANSDEGHMFPPKGGDVDVFTKLGQLSYAFEDPRDDSVAAADDAIDERFFFDSGLLRFLDTEWQAPRTPTSDSSLAAPTSIPSPWTSPTLAHREEYKPAAPISASASDSERTSDLGMEAELLHLRMEYKSCHLQVAYLHDVLQTCLAENARLRKLCGSESHQSEGVTYPLLPPSRSSSGGASCPHDLLGHPGQLRESRPIALLPTPSSAPLPPAAPGKFHQPIGFEGLEVAANEEEGVEGTKTPDVYLGGVGGGNAGSVLSGNVARLNVYLLTLCRVKKREKTMIFQTVDNGDPKAPKFRAMVSFPVLPNTPPVHGNWQGSKMLAKEDASYKALQVLSSLAVPSTAAPHSSVIC